MVAAAGAGYAHRSDFEAAVADASDVLSVQNDDHDQKKEVQELCESEDMVDHIHKVTGSRIV